MVMISQFVSWKFSNWLENEQPKQERHSMQIPVGIQCLLLVGYAHAGNSATPWPGNKFSKSF
jgi:hypothetical protein